MTDSTSLAGEAAALNLDLDVELAFDTDALDGLLDDVLQGLHTEVVIQSTIVDGDDAGAAGDQTDASNRALSSAGAVEISLLRCIHCSVTSPYSAHISGF